MGARLEPQQNKSFEQIVIQCLTFVLFIDHNIYTAICSIARFKDKALNFNEKLKICLSGKIEF